MPHPLLTVAACGIALLVPTLAATAESQGRRPNVVLIMADDMGFSDIGCYGSEIPTPNLDRLAASGVRFSQYYSNAKCEPSRNSLMTGQYPFWKGADGRTVQLPAEMRDAGYRTCIVGKVHAHSVDGFQHTFTMDKAGSYWDLSRGTKEMLPLTIDGKNITDLQARFPGFYTTDAFADEAVRWLDEGKKQSKPFFLYLAFNAPHFPLHAPAEDIARFRGKYKAGWDALREARFQKQLKLGLWPAGMRASPREDKVRPWTSLTPQEQDREDLRMATYAAMVARLDTAIGRVLKQIEAMQATKDTVVMFCSDNGACAEEDANRVIGPEPGPPGSWWYTGPGWAWMSNTPFRKFKTFDHEGGISDPLIVSWPGQLKPGNDTQMAVLTDLTATCLALAGRPNDRILGKPLLPGAGEGKRPLHETHCWALFSAKAVREGDLKAVAVKGAWELHDMAKDRTELDDLAEKRPQDLARLVKTWDAWVKQVNILGGGKE